MGIERGKCKIHAFSLFAQAALTHDIDYAVENLSIAEAGDPSIILLWWMGRMNKFIV